MSIHGKKILIIGGTGSLGNKLTERYLKDNIIYLLSRDESKHWAMSIDYQNHPNLNFIIGNISDVNKMRQTLIRHNFDIIILAAAMKHIDRCEYETNECIQTNLLGTQIVLNEIENNISVLTNLKTVCFISTDKACSPVNVYGMSKAISECLMIEKSKFIPSIKFVCVRYGNVLNSRGSIIPTLHKIGENKDISTFKITDERMTRFVMTLEQSVDLVEHAILKGESGDVVIPKLVSCNIKDLIEIFSELYNKPIEKDKLRPGEKMLESLINETQSLRLIEGEDGYTYIKPPYKNIMVEEREIKDYNSTINPLNKEELKEYLLKLGLIFDNKMLFKLNISPKEYQLNKPFPYCVIKNILPDEIAIEIQTEILNISDEEWDRYQNPFENKYTLRDKNKMPPKLTEFYNFLTSEQFVNHLSNISGDKLYNDPTKNWWGVHKYDDGDYLDIHCDAGIHPVTGQKKRITLGFYLSSNWKEENGGHLEIWEGTDVTKDDAEIKECVTRILPSFNKLIMFDCNDYAWHGNPEPVKCKNGEKRIFLTLSYVSETHSEPFKNNRKKAFFVKRPQDPFDLEKDRLRFLRADPEKYKDVYRICESKM